MLFQRPYVLEDNELLRQLGRDLSGNEHFDPIAESPTQPIRAVPIALHHAQSTRHSVYTRSPWPLEHMFAAVCAHIRHRVPIPRHIVLSKAAYYKHLQDPLVPQPFDGLFVFQVSSMGRKLGVLRPFSILVHKDIDFGMILPPDIIMCID